MLRALLRLNGKPAWLDGIRVATAMFVPIVIGAIAGKFIDGLFIGVGGMLVAACDAGGPYARRARVLAITALGVAVAFALGVLVGQPTWLATICVFVVVTALGLLGALGMSGAVTGFIASVAFVVGVGLAGDADTALRFLWQIGLGGAFAVALSVVGWPMHPDLPVRHAVGAAYAAVAALARAATTAKPDEPLAPAQRSAAIAALTSARDAVGAAPKADRDRLDAQLRGAGTLFDAVVGLGQFRQAGPEDLRRPPLGPQLDEAFGLLAGAIAHIGTSVADGRSTAAARELPPLDLPDRPALTTAWGTATNALRAAATEPDALPPAPPSAPAPNALAQLRAQLDPSSVVLRHAVRVGVVAAVGIVLSRIIDPDHGTWMTTAAMIVLKPDFGGTLNFAIGRGLGTVIGGVIAGLIAAGVTDRPVLVALAALFTAVAMALLQVNYTLFMVLVTPLAVLLVAVASPGDWQAADERVLDTLIGVALALVGGYLLWPSWERRRLPDQLAGTVDADRAYLKMALLALAGGDARPTGAERARAERENGNAAASLQRLRSEPARERGDPQPVDALATHAQRLVDAATALAQAASTLPAGARESVEAFATHADRAMAAMATAAAGGTVPEELPALEHDLPSADGDPRSLLVRRELEEVALDIAGMHAALDRLAAT